MGSPWGPPHGIDPMDVQSPVGKLWDLLWGSHGKIWWLTPWWPYLLWENHGTYYGVDRATAQRPLTQSPMGDPMM